MVVVAKKSDDYPTCSDDVTTLLSRLFSKRTNKKFIPILCITAITWMTFYSTTTPLVNRRPIMHTFYHLKSPEEDQVVELWRKEWTNAGFRTRVLTLEDAVKPPAFKEVERIMEPLHGSRSHEAMCFYRWFAMAALGGGWLSESDTFPTNFPLDEGTNLPNGGIFTSFQAHIPALMSGTGVEWNRVANLLIDVIQKVPGDVKTDEFAFQVLRDERIGDINFNFPPLNVQRGFAYDDSRKVNCEIMAKVRAIHFSHSRTHNTIGEGLHPIVSAEVTGMKYYRADAYNIFLNDWRMQCNEYTTTKENKVSAVTVTVPALEIVKIHPLTDTVVTGRPIMHTFYHSIELMEMEDATLDLWREEWTNAGFDTKVLNLEDAKRHPDFTEIEKAMIPLYGSTGYNAICFYRWLAMAVSGGGWMSDHDTFPVNFPMNEGIDLPNGGHFTSFQAHIPALMSGTAAEWDRVAKLVISAIPRIAEEEMKTDMNAFNVLQEEGSTDVIFMMPYVRYVQMGFIYDSPRVVNCEKMARVRAVHISHAVSHQAIKNGLYPIEVEKDDPVGNGNRAAASKVFLDDWREQCGESTVTVPALEIVKEVAIHPVMHTFYHSIGPYEGAVLDLWREEWTNAGFDTKVLTIDDAKKHPNFDKVETSMIHLLLSRGQDPLPFYQWMAMAKSGGGWISAYDTFPTNFALADGTSSPNDGAFTSFQDTVPSLMSGSSDEWDRVSRLLIDAIPRVEGTIITVMHALEVLKQENANVIFMEPDSNVQDGFVYDSPRKVNCDKMSSGKAIQIAISHTHSAVDEGLYPLDVEKDDPHGYNHHAEAAKLFLDDWRNQCR